MKFHRYSSTVLIFEESGHQSEEIIRKNKPESIYLKKGKDSLPCGGGKVIEIEKPDRGQ